MPHLNDYPGWLRGFPGGSAVKNPPANAGDVVSIPGSGRSPGEGNDNPLQYSCLENPMERRAWWAIVCGVAESDSKHTCWSVKTDKKQTKKKNKEEN